ncbi:MAG TPA: hypothetical protein VI451_14570 [Anaerolineales bacterium]|nr:hypothetical protein [Anaerolineales bacterium]
MGGEGKWIRLVPIWFFLARVVLFLSLTFEGVRGYTDYWNYFSLAGIGWPYFDFWVEYPPVFPFLISIVYRLVGGSEHGFVYVMVLLSSAAQAVGLGLFIAIGQEFFGEEVMTRRVGWYTALLVGLFYGWGFIDSFVVAALLAGLFWLTKSKNVETRTSEFSSKKFENLAGIVLGVGGLLKWFPLLALAAVWRYVSPQRAARITVWAVGMVAAVFAVLYLASPDLTVASIRAQGIKVSWQSVWALMDGNVKTGNFGTDLDFTDPATAEISTANPARIPRWLTLLPFVGLGLWLFSRARLETARGAVAFTGLTLSIFMLWSPGWSPQWSLYFLPLILLALRERVAVLMGIVWVGINLLEWPLLLSRGWFIGLWLVIPVRTLLLVLLAVEFWRSCEKSA